MIRKLDEISEKFFGKKYEHLDEKEKKIVNHLAKTFSKKNSCFKKYS